MTILQKEPAVAELDDKRLVQYVMDRMSVSETHDRQFKDRALKHWKHLNNILPSNHPFHSRFFEPETSIASNDVLEGIMTSIFQKDQYFDLLPEEGQGDVPTEMMRMLMTKCLREYCDYKQTKYYQLQECVFFGNGVEKHTIDCHVDIRTNRQPLIAAMPYPVQIGWQEETIKKLEFWPKSSVLSRFDCYPSPTGASIQKMPYFIERCLIPVDTAKAIGKRAGWRNLDKIVPFFNLNAREGNVTGSYDDARWDLWERLRAIGYDVTTGDATEGSNGAVKYCELLIYSEAPVDGEGCNRIIVMANREYPLSNIANPYKHGKKPYSDTKFQPLGADYWQAKGVPELVFDSQERINTRINHASDIMLFIANPMTLIGKTCTVQNKSSLTPYPGAIVQVGDVNAIRYMDAPNVPQEIWLDLNQARGVVQRSTSSPDYMKGAGQSNNGLAEGAKTATGMNLLMNASNSAKTFKWLLNEEIGIKQGLDMTACNIQQFMSDDQKVRIIGENKILKRAGFQEFVTVTPDDIAGKWSFYAVGASRTKDASQQAQLMQALFQQAAMVPEIGKRLKSLDIFREIAELTGVKNVDRFLMSDEELQAKVQQEGDPGQNMLHMKALENLSKKMTWADLGPELQAQIEQALGFKPDPSHSVESIFAQNGGNLGTK